MEASERSQLAYMLRILPPDRRPIRVLQQSDVWKQVNAVSLYNGRKIASPINLAWYQRSSK